MSGSIAEQRAAVVAEALTWAGTPYHNCANLKGVGVDCAMILVEVFAAVGLIAHFDPRPYAPDWHLHQDEPRYVDLIQRCGAHEVQGPPQPGDIACWKVGRQYAHGGIVTAWPRVLHAYAKAGMVLESDVSLVGVWTDAKHPKRFFSFWSA